MTVSKIHNLKKASLAGVLLVSLLLPGCVGTTAPTEASASPVPVFGNPPVNTEATIRNYLKGSLKDPDSLKGFAVQKPKQGAAWGGIANGFKKEPRWYVCFTYNAKNSYGGYGGQTESLMWFEPTTGKPMGAGNSGTVNSLKNINPYHEFSC
ncbi:hypothetical protein N9M97_01220 [Planktomarina temperata]|nr:hypothetical protein [Planktomarina temperata]